MTKTPGTVLPILPKESNGSNGSAVIPEAMCFRSVRELRCGCHVLHSSDRWFSRLAIRSRKVATSLPSIPLVATPCDLKQAEVRSQRSRPAAAYLRHGRIRAGRPWLGVRERGAHAQPVSCGADGHFR